MKTVLVVEDDANNWRVFQKILTKRGGLAARLSENVEEVMQIAQSGEADLILMDVSLSNSRYQGKAVDGITIAQMLKTNPKTAKLPVILITAHVGDHKNFLAQSGADGFIAKPVLDQQEFVNQILAKLSNE